MRVGRRRRGTIVGGNTKPPSRPHVPHSLTVFTSTMDTTLPGPTPSARRPAVAAAMAEASAPRVSVGPPPHRVRHGASGAPPTTSDRVVSLGGM